MNAEKKAVVVSATPPREPRRKYRVVDSTKADTEAGDIALANWLERLATKNVK